MSDADDDSGFDKEAEREKLREKYERDKADREATQRMSDLLLKGATMTNTHCDVCGDPYFRQDGATFCPTCHGSPDAVEASLPEESQESEGAEPAPDAAGPDSSDAADAAPIDVETPDESATGASETARNASASTADRDTSPGTADSSPAAESDPADRSAPGRSSSADANTSTPTRSAPTPSTGRVDGDLETARDALVESLERFAREAAATDDPRYAAECLEAAREAAEALSALR